MSLIGGRAPAEDPVDDTLPAHLRAINTGDWTDLIWRLKISPSRKAAAMVLAFHSDTDGSNVFPGERRIGDMLNLADEKAVRAHLRGLEAMNLLHLVRRGGGRKRFDADDAPSNVYRLVRPADLATLGMWLDPDMRPVPTAVEAALGQPELRVSAPGETTEYRASTPGEAGEHRASAPAETPEHRASTPGEGPVDNPGTPETPGVHAGNTGRLAPKHRASTPPYLSSTKPQDQNPLWSPQVGTSLAKITDAPSAAGTGHGIPTHIPAAPAASTELAPNPSAPDGQAIHFAQTASGEMFHIPSIITGSASLLPDPDAYAAAHAHLSRLHDAGQFFQAAAIRDLRAEGDPDPPIPAIVVRAAQIAQQAESRSA